MAFQLEFSAKAERDFGLIFGHLLKSYKLRRESDQACRSADPGNP
jgi:plasmid stabilization system protein ParE